MAGVRSVRLSFRFGGRPSPARLWDIRFRVAATAVISACLLAVPPLSLLPLGFAVLTLLALARSRVTEVLQVVWGFTGFLVFFVGLGVLFEPTWVQAAFLAVQALRLVLLLLLGHFLFLTATPSDVTEAIRWYLGWLGPSRAWSAASMAGWALNSVPLILDQAASLLDAAALRGLTVRRHPLRTLNLLTLALLIRTVERSTDLAASLEVRGFGQSVPPFRLAAQGKDWAALGLLILWCAGSWAIGAILPL